MKHWKYFTILIILLTVVLSSGIALAQEQKKDDWKFSGSLQIRPEMDGRDFLNSTYPYTYTSLRTRFGVEKTVFDRVSLFVQLQDSRQFGDDGGMLAPQKNLNLQQGYFVLTDLFSQPLSIKGGRFEMKYGSGRIIQSSAWSSTPRAFDGTVINYKTDPFSIDLFAITNKFSKPLMSAGVPDTTVNPYPAIADSGSFLWGFWGTAKINKQNKVDLFTIYEYNAKKSDKLNKDLKRFTSGINYELTLGALSFNAEFAYQFGSMNAVTGKNWKYTWNVKATDSVTSKIVKDSVASNKYTNIDLASWMAYFGVKYKMKNLIVSLNADILSGSDEDKYHYFYSDYASKHTFFGYMDYFSNLEKSTSGKGINDYFLRLEYLPKESSFSAQLDGHFFMTNVPYVLSDKSENSTLGQEIDLLLRYSINKSANLEWGGSLFLPGDVMTDIYKVKKNNIEIVRDDIAFWSYLMLRVNL